MPNRHFLTLMDMTPSELERIIARAIEIKANPGMIAKAAPAGGLVMGMIFEKSSTRTRVSFEAGMVQLGGHAMFLSPRDTQLGRGEPIEDTARVISSMVDIVMIRTFAHEIVERFARVSRVPVINGLTDEFHPCQLLADIQTYVENRGSIRGKRVAWIGDGNNMCQTYIQAATQFDFELRIACPPGYEPDADLVAAHGDRIVIASNATEAARNADLLVTDVWASMGQEAEQQIRETAFADYQLDRKLLDVASPSALYMHCLPAHRGEEISAELMDAEDTVIWEEAENRLHSQKALIEFLLQAR